MIYLKASQSNTIVVTWTERATSPTSYRLRLINQAELNITDFTILASSNASSYTSRYDKFTISVEALDKGQYRYEVVQDVSTNPKMIETGLAFVETTEETYNKTTNTIDYISYNL